MTQGLAQQGPSSSALWVGPCPATLRKLIRGYNIKLTSWENLNSEDQSHFQVLFLAPDGLDRPPQHRTCSPVLQHSQSRVLVCLSSRFKPSQHLSTFWLSLCPEAILCTVSGVEDFLSRRFKTADEVRGQVQQTPASELSRLVLPLLDYYDHPLMIVDAFGRWVFKNAAAMHLLKGLYFPRGITDLLALGRFYALVRGQEHLIPTEQLLKQAIFPRVFKTQEEYMVQTCRLEHLPQGRCTLLIFKNRGKFEVAQSSSFFLDSRVVIQSMFHELSSPVTSIGLALEMLKDQPLTSELQEDLRYCWDAYERLKTLTSDLPQFFFWEESGMRPRKVSVRSLGDDLYVVLNVQLKRHLKYKHLKQLSWFGRRKSAKILCVRSALFQAFQELVHFLLEFCQLNPAEVPLIWHPFTQDHKFYIDFLIKKAQNLPPLSHYARTFSEDQASSVHDKSLGLREAVRHAYLSKISTLFQAAGFRLWIFSHKEEIQFRAEHTGLVSPAEGKATVAGKKPAVGYF